MLHLSAFGVQSIEINFGSQLVMRDFVLYAVINDAPLCRRSGGAKGKIDNAFRLLFIYAFSGIKWSREGLAWHWPCKCCSLYVSPNYQGWWGEISGVFRRFSFILIWIIGKCELARGGGSSVTDFYRSGKLSWRNTRVIRHVIVFILFCPSLMCFLANVFNYYIAYNKRKILAWRWLHDFS